MEKILINDLLNIPDCDVAKTRLGCVSKVESMTVSK